MKPVPFSLPPAPSGRRWLWIGGTLVLAGAAVGVGMLASRTNSSTGKKPVGLQGWPFAVTEGSVAGAAQYFPPNLHFYRVQPPNPLGPIVWVLHGRDTDPRSLAPWIPVKLADVVFLEAPDGWLKPKATALDLDLLKTQSPESAISAAISLRKLAETNAIPGPSGGRPWVVLGYDVGADVVLQMLTIGGPDVHAVPDAIVAVSPPSNFKTSVPFTAVTAASRAILMVGQQDPIRTKVEEMDVLFQKAGYLAALRVVPGAGHELAALGPELRDLLLDVFSLYPYPSAP